MSEVLIRGMLCYLGILLVMCNRVNMQNSDVCTSKGLTPGGGPAAAYRRRSNPGCTNTCLPTTTTPEVHVIAHNKGKENVGPNENPKVQVYLQNECNRPVDAILVLMSQMPTTWVLMYGCLPKMDITCQDFQSIQRNINLKLVYAFQTKNEDSKSFVESKDWYDIGAQSFYNGTLNFLYTRKWNWNKESIKRLQNYLKSRHNLDYVSSISRAWSVNEWLLTVGERCCFESTTSRQWTKPSVLYPEPTSDKSPPLSPVMTGSPDTAAVSGSDPQGNNISVIAGTVVLIVILIIVILIGTCWYHHKYHKHPEPTDVQEANMQSLEGTGIHVEPNVYNFSPVSNHVDTHDFSEGHLPPEVDPSAPPLPPRLY